MKNRLKIMEGTGDYMNKNQNIRFNMDKESDIMAWESIHSKDVGERFKSQNRFVIEAINYYYERVMRIQEDPYLETREKEDAFADRIVGKVERKVLSNLPALDRTVKFTVRLNMLNPAHVTINKVLNELNLDIFKSKNQFFIDAATYYIENYGQEELTQPKKEKEPEFVSTEDMEAIEERIRQAAKEEARQEANKEVMTMVGSLLAAIQTGGGAMSVMNKADAAMETGTKSISDEESEDYEEDETLVQSALRWMIND